jgi:hypothetical protein
MNWRNLKAHDFLPHAQAYHKAAKKLAATLSSGPGPIPELDLCPVLSAYRHAIELHLKVLVLGDGGNFLRERPDELSVHKTRSLSWLAQFVAQVITALKWESNFRCQGIANLAAFKNFIDEVNAIDPAHHAFRVPANLDIRLFTGKLDAVLDLLSATADALAAESDLRSNKVSGDDGGFAPTIQ